MIEVLENIFGSAARVKIMRLFLSNRDIAFSVEDVVERSKVTPSAARQEIAMIEKAGLIKKRVIFKDRPKNSKKSDKSKSAGWMLDDTFKYLLPLQNLLI